MSNSWYASRVKRPLDFGLALLAFVILLPVFAAVALGVLTMLGHPVLFRQTRIGRNARTFTIYKFRTMRDRYDASGEFLPDDDRLTTFGRLLRSTSVDELPALLNVVRGEMSLVGPRPLLVDYLPLYSSEQARRHEVRPGMTGWAQVNGRNALSWEARFALDVWYVGNLSFRLDLRILLLTLKTVVLRVGISQEGRATMDRFRGTSDR